MGASVIHGWGYLSSVRGVSATPSGGIFPPPQGICDPRGMCGHRITCDLRSICHFQGIFPPFPAPARHVSHWRVSLPPQAQVTALPQGICSPLHGTSVIPWSTCNSVRGTCLYPEAICDPTAVPVPTRNISYPPCCSCPGHSQGPCGVGGPGPAPCAGVRETGHLPREGRKNSHRWILAGAGPSQAAGG